MPRGHRTRGYVLDGVIDLITDNNPVSVTTLAAKWYLGTNVPLTTELTKEALYTATNASPIAAIATYPAGLGDNPRQVSGCVWIITEVRGDMPSGYLWSPTSSVYSGPQTTNVNDIVGIAALSLASPKITPADCSQLPRDPKEAYRSIFGA
jgi:hypothetical protein